MDSYGFRWLLLPPLRAALSLEAIWIPRAPYGFLWLLPPPLLAATALLSVAAWIFMAPYGFVWLLFPQLGLERPEVPKTARKS